MDKLKILGFLLLFLMCSSELFGKPASLRFVVLPFENFTQNPVASEVLRRITLQKLVELDVDVVEIGEVDRILVNEDMVNVSFIGKNEFVRIANLLQADYIVKGAVLSFTLERNWNISYPSVTVNLALIEGKTGKMVSVVVETEGGPSLAQVYLGTEPEPLNEVAKGVVKRALYKLLRAVRR
ncbi:MAG: hypothetical protein ACPLSJ_00600 [Thermosulfidibacteraceae bacterium]|jgi:metal-sulfur cluster biosynthetic enzyme